MAISLFHPGDRHTLRQTEDLNLRIGTATSVTCGRQSRLSTIYYKPTRMCLNGLKRKEINMKVKHGIIIDGVLHEMTKTFNENFDCSECSLCKECKECKMEHESYLCNVMGCFCFVNRGKVTEIKIDKEK